MEYCQTNFHEKKKITNTISFVARNNIPVGYTVTYLLIIVDMRTKKEDTTRLRLTVGGDIIIYPGKVTIKTADLTNLKIHTNSVIYK